MPAIATTAEHRMIKRFVLREEYFRHEAILKYKNYSGFNLSMHQTRWHVHRYTLCGQKEKERLVLDLG